MQDDVGACPKVTVIMAAFNAASTLPHAVQSVLAQSVVDFELVIVDDASTDQPVATVCTQFADPRIRVVRNSDQMGAAESRNTGIKVARAPFIAVLDADDLMSPTRLEIQLRRFQAVPSAAVVAGGYCAFGNGRAPVTSIPPMGHAAIALGLRSGPTFAHGTVMARRDALLAVGGYRSSFEGAEDYDLYGRLLAGGHRFTSVSDVVLFYRDSGTGLSAQRRDDVRIAHEAIALAVRSLGRQATWRDHLNLVRRERAAPPGNPRLRMEKLAAREAVLAARHGSLCDAFAGFAQLLIAGPATWLSILREIWRRRP